MNIASSILSGSLARRMSLAIFLISIAFTIVSSGIYLYVQLQADLKGIDKQLNEVRDSHLVAIGARLWVADTDSLKLDLTGMLNLEAIKYLAIREKSQILVEAGQQPERGKLVRHHPIYYLYRGEQLEIGSLTIEASTNGVYQALYNKALLTIVMIALQTFMVAGLVLLFFNQGITRHLRTISAFARDLELSNIEQPLILKRYRSVPGKPDELDILVEALSTMQQKLNKSVEALRESKENLSLTLNCIGDAVIATDCDGLITRMNPIAELLTGWTAEGASGLSITDVFPIIHATSRKTVENPILQALTTGETVTLSNHTTLLAKNGQEYQIADSAAPIRSKGTIIGAILVFHDVTEQYQMRQSLRDNERRLKLHIDQTPLGVIEWNRDFEVVSWNPAAEKMFAYRREEALGRHATELIVSADVRTEVMQVWQTLLNNQVVEHQINENRTKHGKILTCEWFNTPLIDENAQVIGVASLVDDISERMQAEEKHHQQQLEQAQLLDNMLDAVLSIDEEGIVLSFNLAATSLFLYPSEEIIGQSFHLLMPDKTAQQYTHILTQHLTGISLDILNRPHESWVMNKNGETFPVRLSIATLPTLANGKRRFIATLHDLTVEKNTGEQLRRSQKMDALGKLTGGIAHDYNNMLGIVLGYTELLSSALVDQPILLTYTDQINQAGMRGAKLTKKLLNFSRQQAVEAISLDINTLLNDQQHMLEKILMARINVKMSLSADLWPVWLDASDFEDMLVNLCINAMHAMKSAGELSLETSNQRLTALEGQSLGLAGGDYVQLIVADTGAGMDENIQAHIFDPFFSTKGKDGTGLGLSQVYSFVQRSKGGIKVYSKPDEGTRFSLYFPRYHLISDSDRNMALTNTSSLQGSETILVVEDEPGLLNLATEILSKQGYHVLSAESAEKALAILRTHTIDLLFSDVIMPKVDGYKLAALVKKEFPSVKIQLSSGFNESQHTSDYDEQLEAKLIPKPYSAHTLLERVRSLLDQ